MEFWTGELDAWVRQEEKEINSSIIGKVWMRDFGLVSSHHGLASPSSQFCRWDHPGISTACQSPAFSWGSGPFLLGREQIIKASLCPECGLAPKTECEEGAAQEEGNNILKFFSMFIFFPHCTHSHTHTLTKQQAFSGQGFNLHCSP